MNLRNLGKLTSRTALTGICAGVLALAGCGSAAQPAAQPSVQASAQAADAGTVVIGSKNFTENELLAQMMADLLQAHTHLDVRTKLNMGGTLVAFNALKQGQIDMYPDYTGTGYIEILKQPRPDSEDAMYQYVQQQYQSRYHLKWLKPFGFNDTYALAVPEALATRDHLTTVSSLVSVAPNLVFGGDSECMNRPDCLPGLKKAYGLKFKSEKIMDHSLIYEAMSKGDVQVTDAYSTDGGLVKYHLQVLQDDKDFFPAYYAAPVVRMDWLEKHPDAEGVLNMLAGKIDAPTMQKLNDQVDDGKQSIQQVAHDFLSQQGLI